MPRAVTTRLFAVAATLVLGAIGDAGLAAAVPLQTPFAVEELARYQLTTAVFMRFDVASRSIAAAVRADAAFARDPLFTREIVSSADVVAAATTLETRLQTPALRRALGAAKLSAREYTTFALAVFAARLAHGFVKAGVLRRVPDGVAAANVAFVEAHEQEITSLLADLGIDD
jgi:hypothetical protein